MQVSVCTISFRHHLMSLEDIARWAKKQGFFGLELWGVHAKNLLAFPQFNRDWLAGYCLKVSMLSDYLPLIGDIRHAETKTQQLCRLAKIWGTNKLRTFAFHLASDCVDAVQRKAIVTHMRVLCDIAHQNGVDLVVEIHPNTLCDTLVSTLRFIEEVNHVALRINFDVIHVWEAGDNPLSAYRALKPYVAHMHLKNITRRERLSVFAPANVYAPAGERAGMTELFAGEFNYGQFFSELSCCESFSWHHLQTSLEWFGDDVMSTLVNDYGKLLRCQSALQAHTANALA